MEKMNVLQKRDKNPSGDKNTKVTFESPTEVLKAESDAHRFLDDVSTPNAECEASQGNTSSEFLIQVCF